MINTYQTQVKTKHISSYRKGVPELKNEYGSLNNLLKIILTGGYNKQSVVSKSYDILTKFLTITLPINHGYYVDQVIQVGNNIDFRKEYRIIKTTLDTITLYTTEDMSEFVVTVQGAPLGFRNVFEDKPSGVLCLETGNSQRKCILKSIDKIPPNGYLDTWAKYARVSIGIEIDSLGNFKDNIKAPFDFNYPNAELTGDGISGSAGIHGFAKWDYAISNTANMAETVTTRNTFPTDWHIIGDDRTFYLLIRSQGKNTNSFNVLGFGEYVTYNPLETTNYCLQARDGFLSANSNANTAYSRTRQTFGLLDSEFAGFILSDIYGNITKTVDNNRFRNIGANLYGDTTDYSQRPWKLPYITALNPLTGQIFSEDFLIVDRDLQLRGHHRGFNIYYGKDRYYTEVPNAQGIFSLDVQDPSSNLAEMPIILTLEDW